MSTETPKQSGLYYTVIGGTFRRKVEEGTKGAVKREYETKDGKKGVKHELVFEQVAGHIVDMGLHDGDFGRTLDITLDENRDGLNPHVQFNVETTYGEDVLKRIPHIDFRKEVTFRPYSFEDDGREVRGVAISQDGEVHKNFFWDYENNKAINGLPVPAEDTEGYSKDDWKMHFIGVRKFLIEYYTEKVFPRFQKEAQEEKVPSAQPREEVINPDDIPF